MRSLIRSRFWSLNHESRVTNGIKAKVMVEGQMEAKVDDHVWLSLGKI